MKVKSADGVSIVYQAQGKDKPALFFVHGWCCNRSYWAAQVPYFAQQYTVVTIDLAGHGESGLDRKHWTMAAFGKDVVAVVEDLGLDQVVLIGHSMGGLVIVEAARLLPERVIGLVAVDSLHDVTAILTQQQFNKAFGDSLRDDFVEATRKLVRSFLPPTADPVLIDRIVGGMSAASPEVGLGAAQGSKTHDLAPALQEVRVPMRCINSDWRTTNVEAIQWYALDFKLVLMSGVGHFVMLEDPETFNHLLNETVKEFVS